MVFGDQLSAMSVLLWGQKSVWKNLVNYPGSIMPSSVIRRSKMPAPQRKQHDFEKMGTEKKKKMWDLYLASRTKNHMKFSLCIRFYNTIHLFLSLAKKVVSSLLTWLPIKLWDMILSWQKRKRLSEITGHSDSKFLEIRQILKQLICAPLSQRRQIFEKGATDGART